jgi:hypothetical protein
MTALSSRCPASKSRNVQQIETEEGIVTLRKTSAKKLKELNEMIDVLALGENHLSRADYGVVMQCSAGERLAIKQQSVEVKESECANATMRNMALLVMAIKPYREAGFSGALMPCVYVRPKPRRRVEVGFAYFGVAGPLDGKVSHGWDLPHLENTHGAGFSRMVTTFIQCMGHVSKETGIPLAPIIDMDHRPRSLLDMLIFSFLIHGKDLYCLKIKPDPMDPVWTLFRSTGLREAYALPSVPIEI